jgi:nitrogen regulatory protein P-II 1
MKKERNMKKIEAIIRPTKIDALCEALERVGQHGVTISDVEGHGSQDGIKEELRGKTYRVRLLAKKRVEVIASDRETPRIIAAIREAVSTGKIGDGKIFVSSMEDAVRIRTGESGEAAV